VALQRAQQELVDVRAEADATALSLSVRDGRSGRSLPSLVRIVDLEQGRPIRLAELILRAEGWHSAPADTTVRVPRRRLRVEALHGLETELASQEIDVTGQATSSVTLRMARFHDARGRGWMSGNTHVHLRRLTREAAANYLQTVTRTDDLDLMFVSHLERVDDDAEYITNTFTAADLDRLSGPGARLAHGEEHRHNFGRFGEGYGHVMLLLVKKLIRPVSLGPTLAGPAATDGIPLQRGIDQARKDGATVIWCHNANGLEDVPNWITGRLHALNIFDGDPRGDYAESFYRYLNAGLRVPFSTGTDWFVYDFSRVYVPLREALSPRGWLRELRAGRSFITNGPLLELEAGGRAIGDTVRLTAPGTIRVKARAAGRRDFEGLELVQDGHVVQRERTRGVGGHFEAQIDAAISVAESGWVALRIPRGTEKSELGHPLFAHTSPVYVEVAGRRVFRAADADALQAEVQRGLETVTAKGTFKDDAERSGVLAVYHRALEQLARWRRD
jgi:hypothetical protein